MNAFPMELTSRYIKGNKIRPFSNVRKKVNYLNETSSFYLNINEILINFIKTNVIIASSMAYFSLTNGLSMSMAWSMLYFHQSIMLCYYKL